MKKILALALALMLCLCSVAFADGEATTTTPAPSDATTFTFEKKYVTAATYGDKNTPPAAFPAETLEFTVTADAGNPDASKMISIDDTTDTANDFTIESNPDTITLTIPSYDIVGSYKYTVAEVAGDTQAVDYKTSDNTFGVQVLVTYNDDFTKLVTQVVFTTGTFDGSKKTDEIINTYDVNNLSVKKTVRGNLANENKEFTIKVTFTTTDGKYVQNDITYIVDGETQTIDKNWTGSKDVTLTLKHDETVEFVNIPAGVTYSVVEDSVHLAKDQNAPTAAELNGEEGYIVSYTGETGTISATTASSAVVDNYKNTTVETGIALDNAPYMIVLALVVVAGVMMMKKRSYNA